MTIIQQPDALSLTSNIKDFKIATNDPVSFILKKGTTQLVAQTYEPGQDGYVKIKVRDIIHAQLSLIVPTGNTVLEQTSIVADFTATIDSTDVTFRAIRAGVQNFADTAANFLTANWLTWQPQEKPVTYSTPEYLTRYATAAETVKIKAYYTDADGNVTSNETITVASLTAGKAYTIPMQYAYVSSLLTTPLPAFYDVWTEDASNNRLSYIQRYYAGNMKSEQEDWVLFENSLGGIDTFRAYGATDFTGDHTHNIAEVDEVKEEYRVDTERKYQKNTGYLNDNERKWLLDFFPSSKKYLYSNGTLRSIVVSESNVTYKDKDLPSSYTFTYQFAEALPLLNLSRTEAPAEVLDIVVPDLGNFTVAPRLVEFDTLALSEGALFPVQSPYEEEWKKTTAGALFDFIANKLTNDYNGEGGVGHTHNNLSLLQLLTYVDEYLKVDGQKIKAGYADDIPALINKLITFAQGAKFSGNIDLGEFISGLAGNGARFKPNGDLEARSLTLWEGLMVPELRYNRAEVIAGTSWRCHGGGIIDTVTVNSDGVTGTVLLQLEEGDIGRVAVDDLCMGIWHYESGNETETSDDGIGNYKFAGFGTSYFRITAVRGANNNEFDFTMRPISANYTTQYLPQAKMHFAGFTNLSDTSRQNSVYETTDYSRRLVGLTTWEYSKANVSLQIGDLSNLSVFGIDTTGLGSLYANNVYLTGVIDQSATVPDRLEFTSDNDLSIAKDETTTVTATVYNTWTDVTSQYERFDWTRDSGNSVEDEAWNVLHTDYGNVLPITFNEVPATRTMFTLTGYKPGETIEGQIII